MGLSELGKKLSKLGQDTKNGVQKVSDSVSISNRITQEKKSLERLFAMIGEAVYKDQPDTPKAGLEDEWAAVKVAYANIASYTEQLNNIKGLIYCPSCGRPAATGDKYCAKCGFKLNIRPETTGEKVAKDLRDAGKEVGRIAGDAADRTGEAVGGAAAGTQNALSWLKERLRKPKKETDETPYSAEEEETVPSSGPVPGEIPVDADASAGAAVPLTENAGEQPVEKAGELPSERTEDQPTEKTEELPSERTEEQSTGKTEELNSEEAKELPENPEDETAAENVFASRLGDSRRNHRRSSGRRSRGGGGI